MKLKNSSVLCFVFSLVFSLSLVVSFIEPAWALDSDYVLSVYAAPPTMSPEYDGAAAPVPGSRFLFYDGKTGGTSGQLQAAANFSVASAPYREVDHDRTMYIVLGYSCGSTPQPTIDQTVRYSDLTYYTTGTTPFTFSNGVYAGYRVPGYNHGAYNMFRVTIPAGSRQFKFVTPSKWRLPGQSFYTLTTEQSFIVDTADPSVIDMLDQIIDLMNDMKVELARQTDILNNVTGWLELNYEKVDDIYSLLRNSLGEQADYLDDKSRAVGQQLMMRVDAEQYWNDKNQDNFDALGLDNFQFGDGVVAALGTVGGLFEGIWDALGDMTIIFTFPLILGISLVVIGRISRSGGKGKKGDEDS